MIRKNLKRIPGFKWLYQKIIKKTPKARIPHGSSGIEEYGHRDYVGGLWHEIGRLQFDFLLSQGLKPHHYLLDVACGSLRAGIHLIPFLDEGHYMGIDKEKDLIDLGIEKELKKPLYNIKQPQFIVSKNFEFKEFQHKPDFSIAQSLFTHLPPGIIEDCFLKLREAVSDSSVFYATFFESLSVVENPSDPHDHIGWRYTRTQMEMFGKRAGWIPEYMGNWSHPRNQVMVRYCTE